MRILRRARFYAAHRNERMPGTKCERLHGHRYGVEVVFDFPTGGAVTVPFEDLDRAVTAVTGRLDHRTLVHARDAALVAAIAESDRFVVPWPTSAENVAAWLLAEIRKTTPAAIEVRLDETDSATVIATKEDLDLWPTDTA